jgi:hypothetical protein
MAVIHNTTVTPGKLELLASWLPTQPWYIGTGPDLTKAGGFRLDDPQGEVGIEFMVAVDRSGDRPRSYHVPLTYRGTPLDGAHQALIGTAEHGVLGRRWVYDGAHDPVLVAQLLALLQGHVEPQAQSVTDTPDPSVTSHFAGEDLATVAGSTAVVNGPHGTDITVEIMAGGRLALRVMRVLEPDKPTRLTKGHVTAGWRLPGGDRARGPLVTLRDAAP